MSDTNTGSSFRLYVGNLPYGVTSDQLQELFAQQVAVVDAQVVVDRFTGRSKGFGFVTVATKEAMEEAIAKFHGQDFDGRPLVVNEARPRTERPAGGSGGFGGGNRRFSSNSRGGGSDRRGGGDFSNRRRDY